MTKFLLVVLAVVAMGGLGASRHIHPHLHRHHRMQDYEGGEIDGVPLEAIQHSRPSIVPVNSVLFFKRYAPCPDGYMRDVVGVCREVWD